MHHRQAWIWVAAFGLLVATAGADEALEKRASWQQSETQEVRALLDEYLSELPLDADARQSIEDIWKEVPDEATGVDLLQRTADCLAIADPAAGEIVAFCSQGSEQAWPGKFGLFDGSDSPDLVRNNMRLFYGRWLAQHALYDEALEVLGELKPADVVDPASLLFYQGVVNHRLLNKEACLATLGKLLENEQEIPRRYATLAILMQADLKPLKTDSLDEIARLMDDIERRLGFGRAGTRVRKEEDDVVAKLDKMIEELEKQQQQQQQSAQAGGSQASRPMQDSMPGGGSGPGEVDPKRIGSESDWGNLPPKQRQEALQQISKGLPSHYRDVIEEYFRKLARDGND